MRKEELHVEGRRIIGFASEDRLPEDAQAALLFVDGGFIDEMEPFMKELSAEAGPCLLAVYLAEDWNAEYPPWSAAGLNKKAPPFSGGAAELLRRAEGPIVDALRSTFGAALSPERTALIGYSLGGLFALWAAGQTLSFRKFGSCSGSLWYDGWLDYARQHGPEGDARVYMSLGDKEEKARNPRMAAVGDNTRATVELYSARLKQGALCYRLQEGGHFHNTTGRVQEAVRWLLK